jgi:CMP-N-acetylneuraminic acid synthetase
MKRIAIIPARGGSKRIPKKNIIDFNNKPLIVWTIEAALDSGCFNQVLVSTDCLEIAEIARNAGASVPFLRLNSADDITHVSAATVTALIQAEEYWKSRFDEIVQLMPNCPLRNSQHICKAVANFIKEKMTIR